MPKWESNAYAKIHEGCGGLVRWAEAHDNPHVGYTGQCLHCETEGIPVEQIIPIRVDPDETGLDLHNRVEKEVLAGLTWDESAEWNENQKRLRDIVDE